MKPTLILLLLSATIASVRAASPKEASNPAFAGTWTASAKAYEGKRVSTSAVEVADTGSISSASAYAAVQIVTGTTNGERGDPITVVMPASKVKSFLAAVKSTSSGPNTVFGSKTLLPTFSAVFVTIQGEAALLYGETTPSAAAKAVAPSALLAKQQGATAQSPGARPGRPEDRPGGKPIR